MIVVYVCMQYVCVYVYVRVCVRACMSIHVCVCVRARVCVIGCVNTYVHFKPMIISSSSRLIHAWDSRQLYNLCIYGYN